MTIPSSWKQVPITGEYVDYQGRPVRGTLSFTPPFAVEVDGVQIVPRTIVVTLDDAGAIPPGTVLPSTNDSVLSTSGWFYIVRENWLGGAEPWLLEVDANAGSINIPEATPAQPEPIPPGERGNLVPGDGVQMVGNRIGRLIGPGNLEVRVTGGTGTQVPSDWNATTGVARILNKPTLGTAAAQDISAFATAAQGALADTAVQPNDLATVAASGAYSDLSGTPTLGTAAAQDISAFATAAQGALADTAVQPDEISEVAITVFTDEGLFNAYTPSANELAVLTDA